MYKPKKIKIKEDILKNCFLSNPDGAGFIIRKQTGELLLKKGYFTFKSFFEEYKEFANEQSIIHFRIRTHGNKDKENCHPFWMQQDEVAFAHNGIIHDVAITDNSKSDTWHFNTSFLQPLKDTYGVNFLDNPIMQGLISKYIGWSKLAFLKENGEHIIINKDKGEESDGVWFSNTTYKNTPSKKKGKKKNFFQRGGSMYSQESMYHYTSSDFWKKQEEEKSKSLPRLLTFTPISRSLKVGDYVQVKEAYSDIKEGKIGKIWHIKNDSLYLLKIFDPSFKEGFCMRSVPEKNLSFASN